MHLRIKQPVSRCGVPEGRVNFPPSIQTVCYFYCLEFLSEPPESVCSLFSFSLFYFVSKVNLAPGVLARPYQKRVHNNSWSPRRTFVAFCCYSVMCSVHKEVRISTDPVHKRIWNSLKGSLWDCVCSCSICYNLDLYGRQREREHESFCLLIESLRG